MSDLPLGVSVATRTCCFSALGIMCQVYLSRLGGSQLQISLSTTLAWGAIMLFSRFWGALSDAVAMRRGTILMARVVSSPLVLGYGRMFVSVFLMMLTGLALTAIGTPDSRSAL